MSVDMTKGKAVHIIVNATFERELIRVLKRHKVTGYTQLLARGFGYSGEQDGHSDGETNVMFITLVREEIAEAIEEDLVNYISRGYPIMSYTTEANVLSENRYGKPSI